MYINRTMNVAKVKICFIILFLYNDGQIYDFCNKRNAVPNFFWDGILKVERIVAISYCGMMNFFCIRFFPFWMERMYMPAGMFKYSVICPLSE